MPARLPSVPDQLYLGAERLGLKGEVKPEDFMALATPPIFVMPLRQAGTTSGNCF